ncbi:unnamed protein product [Vitrella brassicaformis CCMP3155]|uniref:Uncharacterized protein n=2 Tax=Vitrella brassicaformis TaxID=1169539 RepID=A0A0G4GTD0_VITBC|nr:unnamed protein product [Vitrella brassicaformis CCMP3155]|mmetsp:Transcript_34410/g.85253  ORF Transcript_34410/g.85253 Transcript_34410/m.85253 type:complete len:175 (+) Transcript_34410:218-742(+)|eukprot:CEM34025.1 unnamed protein product [Vitrella brassicaformis CCMP3155]
MGTKGVAGFRWRGRTITVYNCFDSYPSGLGVAVLLQLLWEMMRDPDLTRWKEQIDRLEKVEIPDLWQLQRNHNGLQLPRVLDMGMYCHEEPLTACDLFRHYGYWIDLDKNRLIFATMRENDTGGTEYDGGTYSYIPFDTLPKGEPKKTDLERLFEQPNLKPMPRSDILELYGVD